MNVKDSPYLHVWAFLVASIPALAILSLLLYAVWAMESAVARGIEERGRILERQDRIMAKMDSIRREITNHE